jgi:Uma2 family endonuclease
MATSRTTITDEELLRLPKDGNKYEVVDGELRISPAGLRHERIVARLIGLLGQFVDERRLGDVLGSNLLYVLPSGNKRAPDVSFVAAGKLEPFRNVAFPRLAPDLAVEVISPGDSPRQVLDRVGEYLQAGVRLVWVIEPEGRTATIYRTLTDVRTVEENGALDAADVLPGFRCALSELLLATKPDVAS